MGWSTSESAARERGQIGAANQPACVFADAQVVAAPSDIWPAARAGDVDARTRDGASPLTAAALFGRAEKGGNALVVLAIVFVSIAAGAALVGGIIWLVYHFEKKRTEALEAVAREMGLEFSATKDDEVLAKIQVFSLFNKGHSRKMKNVMKAKTEIANLTIFDYKYTTGGGKSSHTHQHTVFAMDSDTLSLPRFTLRPEGLFDKIGAAIGFQDIDFDDHPEFSDSFVLKGDNEEAIRRFFDTEMLETFAQRKGIYVESAPRVLIYLRGGRKKPEQIQEFMDEANAVCSAFAKRLLRGQSPDSPSV